MVASGHSSAYACHVFNILDAVHLTLDFVCVQLSESDQDQYRDFNMIVSERWQQEVAETVFDAINTDTDKRRRNFEDENHIGMFNS